jgi:hypothetical protein
MGTRSIGAHFRRRPRIVVSTGMESTITRFIHNTVCTSIQRPGGVVGEVTRYAD